MNKVNIFELEGMEFPAGRRTRVLLGENGAIKGEYYCQGYSVVYPGGCIPQHEHPTVESYTILRGEGEISVDGETLPARSGDYVYIEKNKSHSLKNTGAEDMHVMFVYAPNIVVDHWAQEKEGTLK
ncbi:MAG: cupin domain-containing protein [Treponema sp.]|jgi:quercetin dioxygenase-like cupin family protein|nr:cupin domain-containing protein [Treponema sp.]